MKNKDMDIIEEMKGYGIDVPSNKVFTGIKNSNQWFYTTLDKLLLVWNKKCIHSEDYNQVVDWLTDNEGKGLVLMGSVGLGKTIIARFVIPYIFNKCLGKGVAFYSMAQLRTLKDVQDVLKNKIIVLDDLGVEDIVNEYGNKIDVFSMIVDEVEKENKLLIITTNLNNRLLQEKYKQRSYDRLMSISKVVIFKGQSLR